MLRFFLLGENRNTRTENFYQTSYSVVEESFNKIIKTERLVCVETDRRTWLYRLV